MSSLTRLWAPSKKSSHSQWEEAASNQARLNQFLSRAGWLPLGKAAHVDFMDSQISVLPPLAFSECTLLKSIYLSDTLSVIGDECFAGCGFERFNIPASVSQLGSRALGNNKDLVKVSLDSNTHLSSIVSTSFSGCSKLREFVFDGKSLTSSSIDGVLFNEAAKVLCAYPPAHECGGKICDHYEVPASFTAIGPSTFLDSKLVSITMHSEVIEIGSRAFDSCNNLKRIVIEAPSINVGVLSFDGVKFSCGFFECNENVHQLLKDVEIPDIALSPCSTDYPSLLTLRYLMVGQNIVSSEE